MIYLDYAASTPLRKRALHVLEKSLKEDFANPSSAHKLGTCLYERIEMYRKEILKYLEGHVNDRMVFTSSATESNNMVFFGLNLTSGDKIMFSRADHASITAPADLLKNRGIQQVEIKLKADGSIDEEKFWTSLDSDVKLIVFSYVNNQCGTITDFCKLSTEIKKKWSTVHIHIDAAQGFGKLPFSLKEARIDSLSISSHKIGGPKGIAGLYLKSNINLTPLMYGGGQENHFRPSTQAAPLIFGFYEAIRESFETIQTSLDHVQEINKSIRDNLNQKLSEIRFPYDKVSSPYILTFILPHISSDIILRHLETQNIIVSSTSACSSRVKGKNPVFDALHIPPPLHKFVLRVSFSHETLKEDVEFFCSASTQIYNDLKQLMKRRD